MAHHAARDTHRSFVASPTIGGTGDRSAFAGDRGPAMTDRRNTPERHAADEPVPVPDVGDRPEWWTFDYSLHNCRNATVTATRGRASRTLKELRALRLRHGSWAIARHDDEHAGVLAALIERITGEGGAARLTHVGFETEADIRLQSTLNRACERLWDDFFNEAEFHETHCRELSAGARHEAVAALRSQFCTVVPQDIVMSDALTRAEAKLDDLAGDLVETGIPETSGRPTLAKPAISWRSWKLRSGRTAFVAHITPTPSVAWELAFRDFETFAYLPAPDRVPLRHGTFRWIGPPAPASSVSDALMQRIGHFESLAG